MRYLGNKSRLLTQINNVINKYDIKGNTFADLFSGTGVVGDYFKDRYIILSNDYMYFSSVLSKAKILNNDIPRFTKFREIYKTNPFNWLNSREYSPNDNYFIYNNYTIIAKRQYLSEENALRIDGNRMDIEEMYQSEIISENEYFYLLGSLIENVPKVSNTSGTYQAFLKFWDNRSLKRYEIKPLMLNKTKEVSKFNSTFCENTNELVRKISGDIAYIDPPYTTTQYTNSYHLLETIARYDYPEIFGKTGRRSKRTLSSYSNKKLVLTEFEDLFRQIRFKHIIISYSNQSILKIDELVDLAKIFAVNNEVYIETNFYREYSTNNQSNKGNGAKLEEVIIYFEKDLTINKSPLNYSGSKDQIVYQIIKELPKNVDVFVDAMGGAFNVGANIIALKKVIYNEINPYVFGIMDMLINNDKNKIIEEIEEIVKNFGLSKKNKISYLTLRDYFNKNRESSILLFTLQIYAFQNMIRFNSKHIMNTPVGNNEYNTGIRDRILNFKIKSQVLELKLGNYEEIELDQLPQNTLFYFDPPYFITQAEYNDGKRGLEGWGIDQELKLLNYLLSLDQKGFKFVLSNVLSHGDKKHYLLIDWIETHEFKIVIVGKIGIKYPRVEVIIKNF